MFKMEMKKRIFTLMLVEMLEIQVEMTGAQRRVLLKTKGGTIRILYHH